MTEAQRLSICDRTHDSFEARLRAIKSPAATVRVGERRSDGLDLWVVYRVERSHVCASVVGQPARSFRFTRAQWATLTQS